MAYFDDPERMESWKQELKGLRAERSRRQNKGAEPAIEPGPYPEAESAPETVSKTGRENETLHEIAQRISATYAESRGAPRSPVREEISFEQLEAEAGVKRAPSAAASKGPGMQKELAMDREMS